MPFICALFLPATKNFISSFPAAKFFLDAMSQFFYSNLQKKKFFLVLNKYEST